MKRIMHFITFIIVITLTSVIRPSSVFAADFEVSCTYSSGCTPSSLTAFFPSSYVWYPDMTVCKTVSVNNSGSTSQILGIRTHETLTTGNLDQVISMTIKRGGCNGSVIWTNSTHSLYGNGETVLDNNYGPGTNDTFAFVAHMDPDAGNEYQAKTTQFDLIIGFIGQPPESTPTPTPSSTITPTPIPGKFSSLATSCTDSNFDAIMELKNNGVAQSGIKVKFTYKGSIKEANTGADGKAIVGYTLSGDDEVKAEPDNGYPNQSVTIRQSSCSHSPTPTPGGGGGAESVLGLVTQLFAPQTTGGEVAGAETELTGTPIPSPSVSASSNGSVEGTSTQTCNCIWWQILLGELIVAALYFFLVAKDIKQKRHGLVGLAGVILTFVIFRILNNCLTFSYLVFANTPSLFCKFFIIIDALIMLTILLFKKYRQEKQDEDKIMNVKLS